MAKEKIDKETNRMLKQVNFSSKAIAEFNHSDVKLIKQDHSYTYKSIHLPVDNPNEYRSNCIRVGDLSPPHDIPAEPPSRRCSRTSWTSDGTWCLTSRPQCPPPRRPASPRPHCTGGRRTWLWLRWPGTGEIVMVQLGEGTGPGWSPGWAEI